jgi:pimeloyl-ACP methyl ester carboxylesterase
MPHITRDGIRLVYDEAGSGGPPMLFVHGWGGDARHFEAQLQHFKSSRRVVALDRRGHGRSDKPAAGPYTIAAIAEEVAWTVRELGLHRPILVVHSQGPIGFEVAARNPDLLSALIVLDAPLFEPPPARQALVDLGAGIASAGYRDAIAMACDRMIFLPTDDKARRARLHDAILETPHTVLAQTWAGFLEHDLAASAAACKLPLLCVNAVMPVDPVRLRQLCPQVLLGQTVGAGHMHQLEVPDQINGMIERFLQIQPG